MPSGPQGQRRPADAVGCAVRVAQIATGEIEENSRKNIKKKKVKAKKSLQFPPGPKSESDAESSATATCEVEVQTDIHLRHKAAVITWIPTVDDIYPIFDGEEIEEDVEESDAPEQVPGDVNDVDPLEADESMKNQRAVFVQK